MTISKREPAPAVTVTLGYSRDDDWRANAKCAGGIDDWLWIDHRDSEQHLALAEAKTICGACPSRQSCLEYALSDLSLVGIWAGTTLADRRRMARGKAAS